MDFLEEGLVLKTRGLVVDVANGLGPFKLDNKPSTYVDAQTSFTA